MREGGGKERQTDRQRTDRQTENESRLDLMCLYFECMFLAFIEESRR